MNNTQKTNKTVNNKFQGCPALMADGRVLTDYRSPARVNNMIQISNGIQSSYDYRQFLIHNANNIMKVNNHYTSNKLGCEGVSPVDIPSQSICSVTPEGVKCQMVNANGFGMRTTVPQGTVQQLGMEGHIRGHMNSSYADVSSLTPQFDYHTYARF